MTTDIILNKGTLKDSHMKATLILIVFLKYKQLILILNLIIISHEYIYFETITIASTSSGKRFFALKKQETYGLRLT